jgi:hypothetical protein
MDRGALYHALKTGCWRSLRSFDIADERIELFINELGQGGPQGIEINTARFHHASRLWFIHQRQQQMFKCREFMAALICKAKRAMNRLFKGFGK